MPVLVYGPPGSGADLVAAELSELGTSAVAWDGLAPQPELDGRPDDVGSFRLLRTVASLEACLARWPEDGSGDAETWATARDRQRHLLTATRVVLDTTHRDGGAVAGALGSLPKSWLEEGAEPVVVAESFSFIRGVPLDLDCCLDARPIANPFWVEELRPYPGTDPRVSSFVLQQEAARQVLETAERMVESQLRAEARSRPLIRLAVGCTGGRHRSVAIAEELRLRLTRQGARAVVWHRDLKM
jgi:RNase adaptor protein for sRNA GlmZ degradation